MMIRAIRGATVAENTAKSIKQNAGELLKRIFEANRLDTGQIISILFTCTKDLNTAYPAAAAREMGIVNASLMCAQEMDVAGSLTGCIRVQVLAEMDCGQGEVRHVYLKEAAALRPDLSE